MDAAGTRTYYATVAPFYDSELATRDDLPFWHTLVATWRPRSSVEYGCGTGRVAIPLARQCAQWGGSITGLDLSPAMLRLARLHWQQERGDAPGGRGGGPLPARTARQVSSMPGGNRSGTAGDGRPPALLLYAADMRQASLSHPIDLALFADDPLTHLAHDDDLAACFRRVGAHLRPGGHLVVEASLLPPEARGQSEPVLLRNQCTVQTPGGNVVVDQQRRIDPLRGIADVVYRYHPPDGDEQIGSAVTEARFVAHYLDLECLAALFQLAGCRMEERWGDFHFHALAGDSAMALCTGTKE
jgi:SAM-dependent methyltransferase